MKMGIKAIPDQETTKQVVMPDQETTKQVVIPDQEEATPILAQRSLIPVAAKLATAVAKGADKRHPFAADQQYCRQPAEIT